MKYKRGNKVRVLGKTVGISYANSSMLRETIKRGQEFLYYHRQDSEDPNIHWLSIDGGQWSNRFHSNDFEHFIKLPLFIEVSDD